MDRLGFLLLTIALQGSAASPIFAQSPATTAPSLAYTLSIDTTDLSGYSVSIRVYHPPHRFHLAMATHHEYDDRFWKCVKSFQVDAPASFIREDSAVWAITAPGDRVSVSYRIQLPPSTPIHFSHRPFLTSYGGLVGDLHSFMYLAEDIHAPCALILRLPDGWQAASGLDSISSAPQLLDAPILVGRLHRWSFKVESVPQEIDYLSSTNSLPFDTILLISDIRKIVRATRDLFGGYPYKHYCFLLEDKSAGALEHDNSVTIGVPAAELSSDRQDVDEEIAHEFFHTWNLMDIRPSGYTELNYGTQQQSPTLWFSEGVTMLYADLICRRLGLQVEDSTRIAHLTSLITRYYSDTGNVVLAPSRVSLASNVQPGPLGDYSASTHLQGELLGACLDILIRDATNGRRSLDDVMREIYRRFGGHRAFADSDIEAAVTIACGCTTAHAFFRDFLYDGKPIDFTPWLDRLGLRLQNDQPAATDPEGRPLPDTRVYSWIRRDDTSVRIGITNPNGCWALAGLHTGDILVRTNGRPIHTRQDFQAVVNAIHIGDEMKIDVKKEASPVTSHTVYISGYTIPSIHIDQNPAAAPGQQRLLQQWLDTSR
jgi:predicted metalloprotease with PDZ domain